jgi:predicted nucleic acid-binding protein
MRLAERSLDEALQLLGAITAHPRHRFWPDALAYGDVRWHGVIGHRQVTDAYLASLARRHRGRLASFDRGLVLLHPDVGVALESGPGGA